MTEVDVRPQRAHHSLGGARVLAIELRGEPFPTFRRRAPRHGCQPCLRGSRLPSRVPSALSPSGPALVGGTTLDQDGRRKRVARRRRLRRAGSSTKRRWHDHRPASHTEQGGACSCSARNRRSPPLPRPEQRRVEGSPVSRRRHDHCSASKTRGPVRTDGRAAPLRVARRRAAPPPDDH